ncbi:MAG: hypothetical protein M1495_04750 [Bacteroidetes bacterium]|nr:hypothetical protein [Bacteroidota bacterium]
MAFRKNNPLGPVSGKIGETVSRIRYGKEVVYSKPASYHISYSPSAVSGRSKFANAVKLAGLVNSVPELSLVWKIAKIKGTNSYQKIIKHNTKLVSDYGLTLKNIITPPLALVEGHSITLDGNKIILEFKVDKSFPNPPLILLTLISFQNETQNEMFIVRSDELEKIDNGYLRGVLSLSAEALDKTTGLNNAILLSAFLSASGTICWSSTIPFELNLKP